MKVDEYLMSSIVASVILCRDVIDLKFSFSYILHLQNLGQ